MLIPASRINFFVGRNKFPCLFSEEQNPKKSEILTAKGNFGKKTISQKNSKINYYSANQLGHFGRIFDL